MTQEWLSLFPEGGELSQASFAVAGFGEPLDSPDLPGSARVGDYVVDDNGGTGAYFTADGKAVPLDAFALAVYANSAVDGVGRPNPLDIDRPAVQNDRQPFLGARWPETTLNEVRGQVCARLDAGNGRSPRVDLATEPDETAAADESSTSDQKTVRIDRGRGAFVRVGDWDQTTSTSTYVIDPRGLAYALVGGDTLTKLGYDGTDEAFIPDAWLELFDKGVSLSTSLALCPPAVPESASQDEAAEEPSASASASASTAPDDAATGCQQGIG